MVKPLLSTRRMQVAVLGVEALHPPVVQLLAQVQHALAVVRMQLLDPELERLEARRRLRKAADVAKPVVARGCDRQSS
jgi:hypothetical protein